MTHRFEAIRAQPGTFAVLDIGSAKVVAFIARISENGELSVIGVGHQLARGIRSGQIQDAGEAQHSIIAAVHAAEQMAGATIEEIFVSVNGSHLRSCLLQVELDVTADGVTDEDILDLIHEGSSNAQEEGREILHIIPVQYYLDKAKGLTDPRGMVGQVLGAELLIISADQLSLHNLASCIARCHLNTIGYIAAPLATARAVLTHDEMELGATVIDMGAGTTGVCVYADGKPIFVCSVPVGGKHVTSDIARGLSTSLIQAERLKTLHASAIGSVRDADVMMHVPQFGEDEDEEEVAQLPRSELSAIVRPRMEEVFELVRQKLDNAGVGKAGSRHGVLSGGASQMFGTSELATRMLEKQIRKGRPVPIEGLADAANGLSFVTAIGMLYYLTRPSWEEELILKPRRKFGISGLWRILAGWFKENV